MSTSNFETQPHFNLYATDTFLLYPYKTDPETDDYLLDENGDYIIDVDDAEPYFDHFYFNECKSYTDNKLNSQLRFFRIDFKDGYYSGIQTYIEPTYPNDFDALDWLKYPQYYNNSQLFNDFGYNTYILKRKIDKEIRLINNDLLPKLASMYNFDKLKIVAQFSNGETWYEKC